MTSPHPNGFGPAPGQTAEERLADIARIRDKLRGIGVVNFYTDDARCARQVGEMGEFETRKESREI